MALWKVQAGKYGEQLDLALENDLVTIGWNELDDLSAVQSRSELETRYRQTYPEQSDKSACNCIGQIWAFKDRIALNDYVVLPLKNRSAVAIGTVKSQYEYRRDLGELVHHTRRVKWLARELPRARFEQDLLYSFGAFMTVCQITRNDAEARVVAIANGKKRPIDQSVLEEDASDVGQPVNIEELANDQIEELISRSFRGHKLAVLVDAILVANGYTTRLSPPGPDGGVDILAGKGPMGFDSPRLCVQVKSSDSPVSVGVFQQLLGTMGTRKADHGLLVSWGGFTDAVRKEATNEFFHVRLWDKALLLSEIRTAYEQLPQSLRAEFPLKRIWVVAKDEEQGEV